MGAKGKRNYPWAWIAAELRARPGNWRLFPSMVAVPISVVERVRRRGHRALQFDDGKLEARAGVKAPREDGTLVADVWLRFKETPPRKDTS